MDINALRHFIVTANALHFGRAAEELGIAQPALSQRIKAIEARLQVRLFDRSNRKISLTEAGRVFLPEAKQLVAEADRAVRLARNAERGTAGDLHIGYSGSVIFEPKLGHLLRRFRDAYPDISVLMQENAVQEQLEALQARKLDIALLRGPLGSIYPGVMGLAFGRSRLAVAIPPGHPLASQSAVTMGDMRSEAFIALLDPPGIGVGHILNQLFERADITPRVILRVSSLLSVLGLVGAGLGLGIVPELPLQIASPAFVLRPLKESDAWNEILLATLRRGTPSVAKRFIAIARDLIQEEAAAST
jgi:DNA-binding transcriptional LysR family regulator